MIGGRAVRAGAGVVAVALLAEATMCALGSPFLPPPSAVLGAAAGAATVQTLVGDVAPSLARVLGGWLIAAALGIGLGTALGLSRTALDYVAPLFAFVRAIPPPVLIPVFLVLFGIGPRMQLVAMAFAAVWPVLLATVDGVRALDTVRTETIRTLGTPQAHRLVWVVLPAAAPKIFAGLRLALSIAVILMVVSELVGATNGIGYRLLLAQRGFDLPLMWAWIGLLGVLGWGLNTALVAVERRALHWAGR